MQTHIIFELAEQGIGVLSAGFSLDAPAVTFPPFVWVQVFLESAPGLPLALLQEHCVVVKCVTSWFDHFTRVALYSRTKQILLTNSLDPLWGRKSSF